jgi:hypothetical protein
MNRNPYAILGIPFGASRTEANIAFARKSRALRRAGPSGMDQLTDLTWALQQIDEAIREPAAAMELYRIPADPEAFSGNGGGILRPPPERLVARRADREEALTELQHAAARQYLRHLVALRASKISLPEP